MLIKLFQLNKLKNPYLNSYGYYILNHLLNILCKIEKKNL